MAEIGILALSCVVISLMIGTHFLHLTRRVRSGPTPLLQNCGLQE